MNHRNNGIILQKIATNVLLLLVVSYQFSDASPFKQTPAYLLGSFYTRRNTSEEAEYSTQAHAWTGLTVAC